jgi:hypothetical protein
VTAENEVNVSHLTELERVEVEEAVEAVVRRDVERVRVLLPPSQQDEPASFWTWANNYGSHGQLDLVRPPGSIEEWAISGIKTHDGDLALDLPVWASLGRTDLTLHLMVYRRLGRPRVELQDMHVL